MTHQTHNTNTPALVLPGIKAGVARPTGVWDGHLNTSSSHVCECVVAGNGGGADILPEPRRPNSSLGAQIGSAHLTSGGAHSAPRWSFILRSTVLFWLWMATMALGLILGHTFQKAWLNYQYEVLSQ